MPASLKIVISDLLNFLKISTLSKTKSSFSNNIQTRFDYQNGQLHINLKNDLWNEKSICKKFCTQNLIYQNNYQVNINRQKDSEKMGSDA